MAAVEQTAPGIGHNAPPSPIEELRTELELETVKLRARRDDLLAGADRLPEAIEDEDTAGRVTEFVRLVNACAKAAEDERKRRKEPFLEMGRAVDGFFRAITDPLASAADKGKRLLTAYQRRKAEEERRRREEEARKAAEEAARIAAEMQSAEDLDAAIAREQQAKEAEKAAAAKAAEMSRTRGDYGAVASLRTVWVGEIVNRDQLDLEALRPHLATDALQRAVNAFVRAGGRQLRGAKIYEQSQTVVR